MGIFDDVTTQGKEMMSDPSKIQKIQQIADEKGISFEDAKSHFMKQQGE